MRLSGPAIPVNVVKSWFMPPKGKPKTNCIPWRINTIPTVMRKRMSRYGESFAAVVSVGESMSAPKLAISNRPSPICNIFYLQYSIYGISDAKFEDFDIDIP
jgi:hypothetical protein